MIVNSYGVSFGGDENVLKLAMTVAQFGEYTKDPELCT